MFITILLGIFLLISITVNIFLYKALSAQLKRISQYELLIDDYYKWVLDIRTSLNSTYIKMKNVDDKSIFYKDDDVGFAFQELLQLIKSVNDRIQQ